MYRSGEDAEREYKRQGDRRGDIVVRRGEGGKGKGWGEGTKIFSGGQEYSTIPKNTGWFGGRI